MDLSKMIAEEMEKALSADAVRAEVKKNLEALCEKAVKEAFRDWGGNDKPGSLLTNKIEEALGVQVSRVDLSTVTLGIMSHIEQEVSAHLRTQVDPVVKARIDALLKPAPAVIDLADIVREYRDDHESDHDLEGAERIRLVFESCSGSSLRVGMHPRATRNKIGSYDTGYGRRREQEPVPTYGCDILVYLSPVGGGNEHHYKIHLLSCRGLKTTDAIPAPALSLTAFERKLYQAFVGGSTIVVGSTDPDDYDTEYPERCEC